MLSLATRVFIPRRSSVILRCGKLHRGSGLGHALDNMAGMSVRFVDGNAVEKSMDHDKLISSLERGFQNFSGHYGVVQPVRTTVEIKEHNGLLLTMPAYSSDDNILFTKLLTLFRENPKHGIPARQGLVVSFNPETGTPIALLDAESITNLRTAAATAVATKHLAAADAKILAIIGSGHQAKSHAKLLRRVRDFTEVRIWSRNFSNAKSLAEKVDGVAFGNVEEAVKDADVVVTVTRSDEPVVFGKWTKTDCLINVVGACRPERREVDDDVMLNSQVIVDTKEGASKESGDVIHSKAEVLGEIGEIISGKMSIDMSKRRVFKSLGMAIEDGIAAKIVLENLKE